MSARLDADLSHGELVDPHRTAKLKPYLVDLWNRRSYMWYVAQSNMRSKQMNTVLGNVWHVLNPMLQIAIYYLIFGIILKIDKGIENFILFLTVGIFTYGYTQRSTMSGANSVVRNLGLVRAIRFPRALLPTTSVATESLALLNSMVVLVVVAAMTGAQARWSWAVLPALFIVQSIFNLGAAMVAARLTVHLRDTTQILPFVFRLGFYGSGVIFSVEAYTDGPLRWMFILNPLYDYLTVARWSVMGTTISWPVIVSGLVWTVTLFVGGLIWFRAGEDDFARE